MCIALYLVTSQPSVFASFRRVATMIMVPAAPQRTSTMEMISISPVDLADAQRIDADAPHE
ncbi:hypothetical protein XI09_17790 [Bradyrhizobium sp. CCBAU 11386]|nr:hypothetical protein [Bradyrhizobium sp. CCBAU 11386]